MGHSCLASVLEYLQKGLQHCNILYQFYCLCGLAKQSFQYNSLLIYLIAKSTRVDSALELCAAGSKNGSEHWCTTGSESGQCTRLVYNRFREWIVHQTCVQKAQIVNSALDLCTTGSESGQCTRLVYNWFREWIVHQTCVQQVQRVDRAIDLYTTGSESGQRTGLVYNRFRKWIKHWTCV